MIDDPHEPTPDDILGDGAEDPAPEKKARKPRAVADEVRLHPILSNAEYEQAQAKARERIEKERRLAAMRAVEDAETERLRVEEGLTTGVREMDEIVNFTVDLPVYCDKLLINGPLGNVYWHGRTYQVPRHVANTLAEMQGRAWKHDDALEGKSITQQYAAKRNTMINARTGATSNAPVRFDA